MFPITLTPNFKNGRVVPHIKSFMWTDSYLQPGEFKIESYFPDLMQQLLPKGKLVTQIDSDEVAVVETHEIEDRKNERPLVYVSGRTFDHIMEYRLAVNDRQGMQIPNIADPGGPLIPNTYVMPTTNSWDQARYLIRRHFAESDSPNPDLVMRGDNIPNLRLYKDISPSTPSDALSRSVPRGPLHTAVYELLTISDIGIKLKRPRDASNELQIILHNGIDRSSSVIFSQAHGDLDIVKYLWTTKDHRNVSFLDTNDQGTYVTVGVWDDDIGGISYAPEGFDRRWIYTTATDIDGSPQNPEFVQQLRARAEASVSKKREIEITSVEVSNKARFTYGKDFFIGDIVGVAGRYGTTAKMRVDSFTKTFDKESGLKGVPTLRPVG